MQNDNPTQIFVKSKILIELILYASQRKWLTKPFPQSSLMCSGIW